MLARIEKANSLGLLSKGQAKSYKNVEKDLMSGIVHKLILTWTNHSDLMRIKGVGPQFSELLEAAGVDTVKELRHRVATNLHAKMVEINDQKNLVNRVPVESEIQKMIDIAKELPTVMTY